MIRTTFKQKDGRIVGARLWRCLGWILFFSCAGFNPASHADDAVAPTNSAGATPAASAALRPLLSTNSASSTFLQSHPELAQTTPPDQPQISLRPDLGSTNAAPELVPPGSGVFPESLRESNPMADSEDLAAHLLVVYNANDPDSEGLARYYASKRNIPAERVLAISAPTTEEITRVQYDDTVRSPIISYLTQKDWMARESQRVQVGERFLDLLVATRNDIWAIVLMRGVPLKIAPDPSNVDSMEYQPTLQTNAAAVDNELALLPVYGLPEGGFVPNLFFDDQVSGIKRVGRELARTMVLVTRLDGPTAADVRRMIDDTLYAENNRLAGLAVVDTRGLTDVKDGYTSGDNWLRSARDLLDHDGWDIRFDDKPDVLPATEPCNQVAIYLGWYHETAIGPWVTSPDRFVRGAIAYHLHSFSASTVRSTTSNWVGPLIAHGAAATMGMVYEPYLPLTPHEDIFTRRLLQGDYFAEAAYASERALSWMLTVVGDPLYRPFRQPLDTALAENSPADIAHYDWLLLQKVQREINAGKIENTVASLRLALQVPGAGPVAEEGLGDMLEKLSDSGAGPAVIEAYKKALQAETIPIDRIRVGLKLAQYYSNHNQDERAQAELDDLRARFPEDAKRFGVSDALVPTTSTPENKKGNSPPRQKPSDPPRLPTLPKPTPLPQ